MTLRTLLLLVLLSSAEKATAHGHRHKPRPKTVYIPVRHNIMGDQGLGAIGGYFAASMGLEFEEMFTRKQWLSATIRAAGYYGGTITLGGPLKEGMVWANTHGYFVAPGIRFHPLRNRYRTDIGIGFTCLLGRGSRHDHTSDAIESGPAPVQTNAFFGAFVAELVVNVRTTKPNKTSGLVVQVGNIYSNVPSVNYTFPHSSYRNFSENAPLFVQVGMRFGGRW